MEGQLGHDLGRVRIHEQVEAARALRARAFAIGQDVFFAPGVGQDRRILAHELAHTIQNESGAAHPQRLLSRPEDAAEREATRLERAPDRFDPGAAPRAVISRQGAPANDPDRHICNAMGLIAWIDGDNRSRPFTRAELFADSDAMDLLDPRPAQEQDLQPVLDLLVEWHVLHPPSERDPRYLRAFALHGVQPPELGTARTRAPIAANRCLNPQDEMQRRGLTVSRELIPRAWWATGGHEARLQTAREAQQSIETLASMLEEETDPVRRASLERQRAAQERRFERSTSPWRLAQPVTVFLQRLRRLTDASPHPMVRSWRLATYGNHFWNEFSADVYLGGRSGPWPEDAVLDFFDRVNAAAELQSGGVGPFAWRAIYNPRAVREAVDAKLGERRLLFHPGHTDHIHLDVRPVEL